MLEMFFLFLSLVSCVSMGFLEDGLLHSMSLVRLLCIAEYALAFTHLGVLGVIWFIFWVYLGFSSPADHPRISKEEREYIESSFAVEGEQIKEEVKLFVTTWCNVTSS